MVGQAGSGCETVDRAQELRPDLVLLDPEIPGVRLRGLDVCRRLRDALPDIAVLLLADSRDLRLVLAALRAGACGYVLKDLPFERLAACLERIRGERGDPFLADAFLQPAWMDQAAEADGVGPLSDREREILGLVAQGRPNKEIGACLSISEHTVRNHIANICGKLRARDRTEAAIHGLRRGLI